MWLTVDVGIGHQNDLAVSELRVSKSSLPMPVPSAVIIALDFVMA